MDVNFPSIQSFYSRELPHGSQDASGESSKSAKPGDGFTSSEVEAALDPLSLPWEPSRLYETCPISLLETGPRNYQILGRIVNFADNFREQGFHLLVVADGSGAFCSSTTTLYPGRNGATHIIVHNDDPGSEGYRIMRCPLECNLKKYEYLPALMTLKLFLSAGYDLGEGKILVCVGSVGPRRTVQSRKTQRTHDMVEVGIFDDTATCILKLWGGKVPSAKTWIPNQTILLISKPTYKDNGISPEIGIGFSSMVDVNPEFPDVDWLRNKVKNMTRKQNIFIPFPSDTWDIERAINGPDRTLFTIADIEERVRHPEVIADFTGKLNVIIYEMKLMEQWRKNSLCYLECCGMPLYSNKPVATCKNCQLKRDLTLNPRIIGSMIDESGMIAANRLVWRDSAWTQLLFESAAGETQEDDLEPNLIEQSWEDLTALGTDYLRDMEEFLLYSRLTLTFGWSSQLERICILGAEW
ncbi:hypothetical protein F5B19DRAFT_451195 [Rostrohypoxylon terebratum]|nr:hypothetical protein F5B19DRAFT_451195 [Rostrohypoxylon terebratum]